MPSLRNWVLLGFESGDTVKIRTNPQDTINAERAIGGPINEHIAELQFRVDYTALRRMFPDHPAARNFREFMEALTDREDLEPANPEDEPMGPTRPVDSED